jgi:hypothetical protein
MAVVVKPGKPLRDPGGILKKIEGGATLLLLYNAEGGGYADALLERTGLSINAAKPIGDVDFGDLKGIPLTENARTISGGTPLIVDANGNAVCSVKNVGEGKIAVFSDPDLFFNMQLGEVSSNLTDKTRLLTNVEFQMMRALIGEE